MYVCMYMGKTGMPSINALLYTKIKEILKLEQS